MRENYKFEYTEGDFEKQYFLLKTYNGDDLLIQSAKNGEISIVKYSLENGYNLHAQNENALRWEYDKGRWDIVR